MKAALFLVIAGGLAIGLTAPMEREPQAPAEPTKNIGVGGSVPKPAIAASAAPSAPPARWGGETRLTREANGHFYANAQVNGQPIRLVVDAGASTVALTADDARRAGIAVDPARFEVIGTGASGPVRGHLVSIGRISVDGREVRDLEGVVLEGLETSLLGQTYLGRLEEVRMSGSEMILR